MANLNNCESGLLLGRPKSRTALVAELFAIGFFAGLALAIPVGPMAIMLINTTLEKGWHHGVAGASAMATVDFLYALTVFLLGSVIASFFAEWGQLLSQIGALILLSLGAIMIVRNIKLIRSKALEISDAKSGKTALKTFGLFALATAVNPPTALYFLAIAPSVAQYASSNILINAFTFAIGVFVGSAIWQQVLAFTGNTLRKFAQRKVRIFFGLIGGAVIVALAIALFTRAMV
jgi:threonine/homoserine/homoserine lactone efflux protein